MGRRHESPSDLFEERVGIVSQIAYFSVDTKLAKLLGETYPSTEAALKELLDNAWDFDADTVWITTTAGTHR